MRWRNLFGQASIAPPPGRPLPDALLDAAYRNIRPHMERWRAAAEPDEYLPLSHPQLFARMAAQACRDVAQVAAAHARAAYGRAAGGDDRTVRHLRPDAGTAEGISTALVPSFTYFARSLEAYAAVHENFCELCGQAPAAAYHHAFENAGPLGDAGARLFGMPGRIAATVLGGFLAGRRVRAELEAALDHYNQGFAALLEAWDDACERLCSGAIDMLASYSVELQAAGSPALPYRED